MITDHGMSVPIGTDDFDPEGAIGALATSLESMVIVTVANEAVRDALADTHSPTLAEPLFVYRADFDRIEYTTNGDTWTSPGVGPMVFVARAASASLPTGDFTAVSFDTSLLDTDDAWSPGSPTRLTAPRAGVYEYFGSGGFSLPVQRVAARVTKGGSALLRGGGLAAAPMAESTAHARGFVQLAVGEWLDFRLYQESGSGKNTATSDYAAPVFGFKWVRP